jgi:hypothetical protein
MVKVSIEVRSGAAHFDVGVRAESIQRAVSFVKERLNYLADELGVLPLDKRNLGRLPRGTS